MKIRNRINYSFFAIFAIGLILIGGGFEFYADGIIKKNIDSYLVSSNVARAEHIRTFIQEQEKNAVLLAAASVYRDLLKEPVTSSQYPVIVGKIDKRLVRTLEADPQIYESFILDVNGKVVASSDKTQVGKDKSNDDYFINAKERVYFKSLYFSESINKLSYTISAPVFDDDGTFLGVSVLRYLPNKFFSIVKNENALSKTEENFLINSDKIFITPSLFLGNDVILKSKVETENSAQCFNQVEDNYVALHGYSGLKEATNNNQIVESTDYRGVEIIGTHAYIPETKWCLITKADRADLLNYQYGLLIFIIGVCLLIGLIIIFVGFLLAKKITKPLDTLLKLTERVKQGDYNFKSGISAKNEIGDLASSFDLMVTAIKKTNSGIEQKVNDQTKELIAKQAVAIDQQKAILNILEDVEAEKNKTEVLAKDLEKFKLAVDNASDHIIITDTDGIILYANKGVERITGFKSSEVLGKKSGSKDTWGGLMDKDFYQKMWDTIKNKKKVFIGELKNRRKNGEEYEVFSSISPVMDESGKVIFFVGIERDITKEKQIDRTKTEFVSLASHQLRTPLSAINWYTEMLLNGDAGKINAEQKQYLEEVYKGNQRMVELVNALLNVSRLELGTFMIEPELIDLSVLASEVINELKPQIIAKQLKLKEMYGKNIGKYSADPRLMKIILQNLLSNAVKYTPDNGKVDISILKDSKLIIVSVKDSGYGITATQQDKIFTKLFRADNVREKDTEGTGLGLYLVKSIVDSASGKIWFESQENKGSTFYVSLPLAGMKKKVGTKELN